jgi:hypothetical protein
MNSVHLSPSVQRFRRVLQIGNPVTIKLAHRDMMKDVNRMSPVDLVNAFRIITRGGQEGADVIESEIVKRKLKGFNGKDYAVLLSDLRPDSPIIPFIIERLSRESLREMRTTDLCIVFQSLVKSPGKSPDLVVKFVAEFLKGDRIKQFREINVSQVLKSLSLSCAELELATVSNREILMDFFRDFLKKLNKDSDAFSNETLAFASYAVSKCLYTIKFPHEEEIRIKFYRSVTQQLEKRIDNMSPNQIVTCIRALGRSGTLTKTDITNELISRLSSSIDSISPHHVEGLRSALQSVDADHSFLSPRA